MAYYRKKKKTNAKPSADTVVINGKRYKAVKARSTSRSRSRTKSRRTYSRRRPY